jgi:hypothetical protein
VNQLQRPRAAQEFKKKNLWCSPNKSSPNAQAKQECIWPNGSKQNNEHLQQDTPLLAHAAPASSAYPSSSSNLKPETRAERERKKRGRAPTLYRAGTERAGCASALWETKKRIVSPYAALAKWGQPPTLAKRKGQENREKWAMHLVDGLGSCAGRRQAGIFALLIIVRL